MEKGQVVYVNGSCGVVLDIFTNNEAERVYKIYFAKNAVRLQPPEFVLGKSISDMRVSTIKELSDEIAALKLLISEKIIGLLEEIK